MNESSIKAVVEDVSKKKLVNIYEYRCNILGYHFFFYFLGILVYFKIPQKIKKHLEENILNIKNQINEAEKLKDESKNILIEHEKKISNSKEEVKAMINTANEEAEKNVIKTNEEFHNLMENKKRNTEARIKQLKNQAIKDIKNASVKIAIESVEKLIKNSLDKSKLDKIYASSIEETKLALKKNPVSIGHKLMAKKTTIIGSGFGGLAAALRLKAKGHKVTLVEKHPDLGGRARVFKKGQFIYDGGPTVITAPYLFEELFSLFNKNISDYVEIVPLDLWYRFVFSNGDTFDYNGDDKSMEQQVKKFNPNDFEGYKNLVNFTEKIFDKGFTDLSDKPFNNLVFMMKQIPSLLKLKSYKSVYSLVSNYISNEKLRRVFSMHPLLVGGILLVLLQYIH